MKLTAREVETQAVDALRACLNQVPFLHLERSVSQRKTSCVEADMTVKVVGPRGKQLMILEVKRSGEPRFARKAVNQLFRLSQIYPDAYGFLVAPNACTDRS